ncbi:MAG: hypothetical protein K2N84_07940 [Clostridia bacterium]|nr:hypothetical protein [Clostridia bacterium]
MTERHILCRALLSAKTLSAPCATRRRPKISWRKWKSLAPHCKCLRRPAYY